VASWSGLIEQPPDGEQVGFEVIQVLSQDGSQVLIDSPVQVHESVTEARHAPQALGQVRRQDRGVLKLV